MSLLSLSFEYLLLFFPFFQSILTNQSYNKQQLQSQINSNMALQTSELTILTNYLSVQTEHPNPPLHSNPKIIIQTIHCLLIQKDQMITALESQLTRYKAEQMKNNKTIEQLQDKIAILSPNTNNTGSLFMMGSQFKEYFDDFMKNTLSNIMGSLISYPQAYTLFGKKLLVQPLKKMQQILNCKFNKICEILQIPINSNSISTLRSCLLKILQDKTSNIFKNSQNQSNLYNSYFDHLLIYKNPQIKEIVENSEFEEVKQKIVKICTYMLLQDKPWQFVWGDKKVEKFVKKDFVCIDGWVKEKDEVVVILQGLRKQDGIRHPNLKNYVIPQVQDGEEFVFQIKEQINEQKQTGVHDQKKFFDQECQYTQNLIEISRSLQNLTPQIQKSYISLHQQNISKDLNSLDKLKKNKTSISRNMQNKMTPESDIREYQKMLDNQSIFILSPHYGHNLKQKNMQVYEIGSPQAQGQSNPSKKGGKSKNSSKLGHNLVSDPSFEQIITLPLKKRQLNDQLPLKRDSSRTKKSSCRKTSVGKIVGQGVDQKQNQQPKNTKDHNIRDGVKQVVYKDMLKQKLGTDHRNDNRLQLKLEQKLEHKTERQKTKNKTKEEDRPLRIMHFKKIREKYLNL